MHVIVGLFLPEPAHIHIPEFGQSEKEYSALIVFIKIVIHGENIIRDVCHTLFGETFHRQATVHVIEQPLFIREDTGHIFKHADNRLGLPSLDEPTGLLITEGLKLFPLNQHGLST